MDKATNGVGLERSDRSSADPVGLRALLVSSLGNVVLVPTQAVLSEWVGLLTCTQELQRAPARVNIRSLVKDSSFDNFVFEPHNRVLK